MTFQTRSQRRRAIIAGAGPGGLAAACALSLADFEVVVCERATAAERAGSGLTLWPNASRALDWLGLLPKLAAISLPMRTIEMRNWRGRVLFENELSTLECEERFCSVGLLRTELIEILSAPIADGIVYAAQVVDVQQRA